ncbi:MAG: AI-2E family transporter, partial [Ignavibacteriales bacterium]|nr:AI-2E family transporter [Ignavibacteriales bacterium]
MSTSTGKKFSALRYPAVKTILVVLTIAIPLMILSQFMEIFLVVVFSIAFTLVLYPAVDYFENKGLKRLNATLAVYGCIATGFLLFYLIIFPIFLSQIEDLVVKAQNISLEEKLQEVVTLVHSLEEKLQEVLAVVHLYVPKTDINVEELRIKIVGGITSATIQFRRQLTDILSTISILTIIPLFVFFGIKDYHSIQKKFAAAMPNKYFEMTLSFFHRIEKQLSNYIRGIVLDSAAVGLLTSVGFLAIGLDYSLILGLLTGIFNIVPLVGPFIGGALPVLVAIIQYGSVKHAILPLAIFGLIRVLDGYVIRQIIYRTLLKMPPLVVLLLIALGQELMGVLGT